MSPGFLTVALWNFLSSCSFSSFRAISTLNITVSAGSALLYSFLMSSTEYLSCSLASHRPAFLLVSCCASKCAGRHEDARDTSVSDCHDDPRSSISTFEPQSVCLRQDGSQ